MRTIITLLLCIGFSVANACSPLLPELIPPSDPLGEWKEQEPPSEYELFLFKLGTSTRIAVVNLYSDFHYPTEPYNAQTEFDVLYGWGKPVSSNVKYVRENTSCGRPKKLEEGKLYVALPSGNSYTVWPFSEVEQKINLLGDPEYRHTERGIVFE